MDILSFSEELIAMFFAAGVYSVISFIKAVTTAGENESIGLTAVENKLILLFSLILGVGFIFVCFKEMADEDFLKAMGYFFKYMSRKVPYAEELIIVVSMLVWMYVILKVNDGIRSMYLFVKRACFVVPMQAKKFVVRIKEWAQKCFSKLKEDRPIVHL